MYLRIYKLNHNNILLCYQQGDNIYAIMVIFTALQKKIQKILKNDPNFLEKSLSDIIFIDDKKFNSIINYYQNKSNNLQIELYFDNLLDRYKIVSNKTDYINEEIQNGRLFKIFF